ncbi:FG-GAP-like repeat-containing protein [Kitasatospora sp. NPDC093806]|uniref:FG-GAP-like repeat-containing protein n=1 Tax=Kitasatospora sp. NPDC093806 TaxID=3155075 RepID=UPI0034291831
MSTVVAVPGSASAAGGVFAPKTDYPVGRNPRAIAVGDFTGSGRTDLAVANAGDDTVSILLGRGDGTFAPQVTYPTGPGPTSIAVADLDGDGRLDLAVTEQDAAGVSVLLGNGDGTFRAPREFPTGPNPDAVAVGDFTGTGRLDLAVASLGAQRVELLRGNGDGTFQAPVGYPTGTNSNPASIGLADLDGDGRLDLAVADDGIGTASVFLGNGDGTLGPRADFPVGGVPVSLAVADLDGDGHPDLALADDDHSALVLRGNGDGTFRPVLAYPAGQLPESIAVGDFTGSGVPDLVLANGDNAAALLRGNGDGTFRAPDFYPTGAGHFSMPDRIAVGRFTGGGRLDVAVTNAQDGTVSVLLNAHRSAVVTTLVSTPNPSAYGSPVTLTDTVCAAPAPGSAGSGSSSDRSSSHSSTSPGSTGSGTADSPPTGTVDFADGGRALGSAALAPGGGAGCAQARLVWSRPRPGTHTVTARYSGDGSHLPGPPETLEHRVTCARTVTEADGPVLATAPSTCLIDAHVDGPVLVPPGAALYVGGSTVDGGIDADGAAGVELCGSAVGALRIAGTTGPVVVGAPEQGCAADRIDGPAVFDGNRGGTEVAGNTITGPLDCARNTPPPVNGGSANSVAGPRTRECAAL